MHEVFNFPINCSSFQKKATNTKIVKSAWGEQYIINEEQTEEGFEVFDNTKAIPALINLVEKIRKTEDGYNENNKNTIKLILDWVKNWGFLESRRFSVTREGQREGQSISQFIKDSLEFYDLWQLYKNINDKLFETTKLDLEKIKDIEDLLTLEGNHLVRIKDKIMHIGTNGYHGFQPIEKELQDTLETYQFTAAKYLLKEIEEKMNNNYNLKIKSQSIQLEISSLRNKITNTPQIQFNNMLNALYMQFFILLSENEKKICPICNEPFFPERKDKTYCSEACKSTAKSRRYRKRKQQQNKLL